jgi:beta-fructofuranosidase
MQHYKPEAQNEFVGDPMPYWHDGTFHFYYLLDRDHHAANGGLGGHQWAHASTRNLIDWTHHPLAVPIGATGEFDWTSICTGSVFEHEGLFYAYYSTRLLHPDETVTEAVCLSTSADCINFTKSVENPILEPSTPYAPGPFRDPCVFVRDGVFHMLVTAELADEEMYTDRRHCIAHYTSSDMKSWQAEEPFYIPRQMNAAECPDWFHWNGFYYITYLDGGPMRYRVSRSPFGPWQVPEVDTLDGGQWFAAKSAAFADDRRIAVGFLRWKDTDDGSHGYAGHAVFREIIQRPDGSLDSAFPPEMTPSVGAPISLRATDVATGGVRLDSRSGYEAVCQCSVDRAKITCTFEPDPDVGTREDAGFGMIVRADAKPDSGYEIRFNPAEQTVSIAGRKRTSRVDIPSNSVLHDVAGLEQPFGVEVVYRDDIIDVCIDGRRCLVTRYPDSRGADIHLFSDDCAVTCHDLCIQPIID